MTGTKNRLPGNQRKKQILICATKVLARSNYQAARVADIAAEAGISEAAVYKYFPSKKSMYLEILRHMSERIITFWQEEVDKDREALETIGQMGLTYYRHMIKHPDEVKVQFQAIAEVSDREIADRLRSDHGSYREFVANVLRKGLKEGTVRADLDIEAVAWIYDAIGILLNMTKLLELEDEFSEKTLIKIMEHMLESLKA